MYACVHQGRQQCTILDLATYCLSIYCNHWLSTMLHLSEAPRLLFSVKENKHSNINFHLVLLHTAGSCSRGPKARTEQRWEVSCFFASILDGASDENSPFMVPNFKTASLNGYLKTACLEDWRCSNFSLSCWDKQSSRRAPGTKPDITSCHYSVCVFNIIISTWLVLVIRALSCP